MVILEKDKLKVFSISDMRLQTMLFDYSGISNLHFVRVNLIYGSIKEVEDDMNPSSIKLYYFEGIDFNTEKETEGYLVDTRSNGVDKVYVLNHTRGTLEKILKNHNGISVDISPITGSISDIGLAAKVGQLNDFEEFILGYLDRPKNEWDVRRIEHVSYMLGSWFNQTVSTLCESVERLRELKFPVIPDQVDVVNSHESYVEEPQKVKDINISSSRILFNFGVQFVPFIKESNKIIYLTPTDYEVIITSDIEGFDFEVAQFEAGEDYQKIKGYILYINKVGYLFDTTNNIGWMIELVSSMSDAGLFGGIKITQPNAQLVESDLYHSVIIKLFETIKEYVQMIDTVVAPIEYNIKILVLTIIHHFINDRQSVYIDLPEELILKETIDEVRTFVNKNKIEGNK